jgi:hypothetical protein
VPQSVEVDGVLVPAGDRRHASRYHLKHRVPDTGRIAAIRHRISKPPAYTKLALRSPQQQQAAIRGLVTTLKIYREFLASDRCQVNRKQGSRLPGTLFPKSVRDTFPQNLSKVCRVCSISFNNSPRALAVGAGEHQHGDRDSQHRDERAQRNDERRRAERHAEGMLAHCRSVAAQTER